MRKRTWISLAVVAAILIALAFAVFLRKSEPPEVARLLPEADAVVYFNLKPLRELTQFDRHPIAHDPDYQAFIAATGIEFERDLDQAAFALQRMANPNGPNGAVAYSEAFEGHFDGPRLTAYLRAHAASVKQYAGHDIYSIPHEGRTVRVAVLGYDLVVVSNTPTPEQIHSMIDRYHAAASPFGGDTLLSKYYSDVPLLSQAWGIGKVGLPFAFGHGGGILGLPIPMPVNATFIASLRYLGSIHLRLEEIASSEKAAKETVSVAKAALEMLRSAPVEGNPQNQDQKDWNALLKSAKITQKGNRAILTAVVPANLVRNAVTASRDSQQPSAPTHTP